MLKSSLVVLLAVATPVLADDLIYSDAATVSCLDGLIEDQDPTFCIGASAEACMEDTQGGWSTAAMSGCLNRELKYWDARLNVAYGDVRDMRKKTDAELDELGSAARRPGKALLAMQRAWIAYRDATCDYERSHWGGGTGGGPATMSCLMNMTAEQALYLEADGLQE